MEISAKKVVYTSFVVDIIDILTNIVVAIITGSVVMTVETIQGFADVTAVTLLLIGIKTASRAADSDHPLGYGRNLYFWTLLSSILMLTLTATISFYLGVIRFFHPEEVHDIYLALGVLILAIVTNGYALSLDIKRLSADLPKRHIFKHFWKSPHIETKATFVLDLMGSAAATCGLISLGILKLTGNLHFDGIGAMAMGVILAILSITLILSSKDLLIGRAAGRKVHQQIEDSVGKFSEVRAIKSLKTVYVGSGRLLVLIDLHFKNDLTTDQIEKVTKKIKETVKKDIPAVDEIQLEPAK